MPCFPVAVDLPHELRVPGDIAKSGRAEFAGEDLVVVRVPVGLLRRWSAPYSFFDTPALSDQAV